MTHAQAMKIDDENQNNHWSAAEKLEIWELNSLTAFRSIGKGAKAPKGYRTIPVFFVYNIKEDGHLKARFVAGGHVLPPPLESVYSGVVSLRSIRLIAFIGELNDLSLFQGDISNAYCESYTKELVVFIACR